MRLSRPCGASLIELLVVIFIMGIMMSLLLPALQRVRSRADETVCDNNVRQLQMALGQFIGSKDHFPAPNHWTVDLLPWIEERPLADVMKGGYAMDAQLPRPPIMKCPFQADFDSRVSTVGFSHFILTVDRMENGLPILENGWNLGDRALIDESVVQEPWYVGPEMSYSAQQDMFEFEEGPHPGGRFDADQRYFQR
jgi:hypothetical protein